MKYASNVSQIAAFTCQNGNVTFFTEILTHSYSEVYLFPKFILTYKWFAPYLNTRRNALGSTSPFKSFHLSLSLNQSHSFEEKNPEQNTNGEENISRGIGTLHILTN